MGNLDIKLDSRQIDPKDAIYLNRTPFVNPAYYRPGLTDTYRWRLVAAEPVNKLAIRTIQREISSLDWKIVPIDDDKTHKQAADYYTDVFHDFRDLVSRTIRSVCELPQGGAWEVGWEYPGIFGEGDRGTLTFVQFIDAGTLHPTIDDNYPIIQINPYNTLQRVMFGRNEIQRVLASPYDEFDKQWWQESPTMASYLAIEALSRIYVYYLKQLHDTPVAGILDLMDFEEKDARTWANSFREMLEGIDPIKIPILYEHTQPAKWLPLGRNPAELSIPDQYKKFAEIVLSNYGLSLGDVRILDQGQTKTGAAANQKITYRSGISFYAGLIEDVVQSLLPTFLKFEFDEPDIDEQRTYAQIKAANARTIQTFDWLSSAKKAEQALKWDVLDVQIDKPDIVTPPLPGGMQAAGGGGIPSPTPGQVVQGEGRVRNNLLDDAKLNASTTPELFTKSQPENVKAGSKYGVKYNEASQRFTDFLVEQFKKAGKRVTKKYIKDLYDRLTTLLPGITDLSKNPMAAKADTPDDSDAKRASVEEIKKKIIETLDDYFGDIGDNPFDLNADDLSADMADIYSGAYEDGMLATSELVQDNLYNQSLADTPFVNLDFNIVDPSVVDSLTKQALDTVKNINEGTKYYMKQAIIDGVLNGDDAYKIADDIKNGLFGLKGNTNTLSEDRIQSIVNTELNKADSSGRLGEMKAIGLKNKMWLTRNVDACEVCTTNESYGVVPIDFEYQDVFGNTQSPPGHPRTCHCTLGADPAELDKLGTSVEYWTGGAND